MKKSDETRYKVALAIELLCYDKATSWQKWFSVRQIADKAGVNYLTSFRYLGELLDMKLIEQLSVNKERRYRWKGRNDAR